MSLPRSIFNALAYLPRKEMEIEHRKNQFYELQQALVPIIGRQRSAKWANDILHSPEFLKELHRGRIHEQ